MGSDNRIKLGSVVDLLQNVSWFQMDTETLLLDYLKQFNFSMLMVARQVYIKRLPNYSEMVTIQSWIYDINEHFGYRNTTILGQDGECCLISAATAAYVDLGTGKAVKMSGELVSRVAKEPAFKMELMPRKILAPSGEPLEFEPVLVGRHHLDYFGHMNNARYFDIAEDCLPGGFSFSRFRVEHKLQMRLGERIFPSLHLLPPAKAVITLRNGAKATAARIEFSS